VNENEERLAAGTFSVVPRTMRHSILPRGKNPLILIAIEDRAGVREELRIKENENRELMKTGGRELPRRAKKLPVPP